MARGKTGTQPAKKKSRAAQSPELAGGEGFTYEGQIGAFYLAALLGEAEAPGVPGKLVSRVAFQQRDFGEPLDDLIVDFRASTGGDARLSLQVKRSLTISRAPSNSDFRDIIRDCWSTLGKRDFRIGVDRFGAAAHEVSAAKARALATLCEWARESDSSPHFEARFAPGGNAGPDERTVRGDIVAVLVDVVGRKLTDEEVHGFLAHFVLISFDFLHDGARDTAVAIGRVRDCLAPAEAAKAQLIWSKLVELARASAGKSGVFDRPRLARLVSDHAVLRGAPSLRGDLELVWEMAAAQALLIQDDVGDTRLARLPLVDAIDAKLSESRILFIRGLPGSGKSVILRRLVARAIEAGPTLFLKGDQLEGKSWRNFAAAHGLSNALLSDLLVEIAASGTPVLFVDALDRVEKEQQPILLDLLGTILRSPLLDHVKIVASLRDSGLESIRIWAGSVLRGVPSSTVEVGLLGDDEAELLSIEKPHLRPLLLGATPVRDIVRRPFFAKILHQGLTFEDAEQGFAPQSEVDLLRNWWLRGGYDCVGQAAIDRQRTLMSLAALQAEAISRPVDLVKLEGSAARHIAQLIDDGILQHIVAGVSVRFSHDIFFEWSFFHLLLGNGDAWLGEIRRCGEPPAVARVAELLAQWEYPKGGSWITQLVDVASSPARSQWTRAWLLGPVGSPAFGDAATYWEAVSRDEFLFLHKALVWFQAEKTTPNSVLLEGDLPAEQRFEYADYYAWPSDFAAWRRFVQFLLRHIDAIPVRLYPDIVSVFQVWQNALGTIANPVSLALLTQCATWLEEIDALGADDVPVSLAEKWKSVADRDLKKRLVHLLLGAASSEPGFASAYLERLIASGDIKDRDYVEVASYASVLAKSHARLLVDATLVHLRDELPDDQVAREEAADARADAMRAEALAKPEAERTRQDQLAIDGLFSRIGFPSFSHFDWDRLAIGQDIGNFSPASPLREPFASLFATAPGEALRLFRALCNHAMTAWRQLHRHDRERAATPIALEIEFPWGRQSFWGGQREYIWFRSTFAPDPIGCGFMALDEWCFAELARGRKLDDLIHAVVEGNECIAVLGVAAMLAMHEDSISEVAFPLVTSQRLLEADQYRFAQDLSSSANLIGFDGRHHQKHVEVIQAANVRPVRRMQLSHLLQRSYVAGGNSYAGAVQSAVRNFSASLPYEHEEDRNDPDERKRLLRQAREYEELVDTDNYRAVPSDKPDQIVVQHVGPAAAQPERQARVAEANRHLQQSHLWAWASRTLDNGSPDAGLTVPEAVALSRSFDEDGLFAAAASPDSEMHRGGVAGAAAVALIHRSELSPNDLIWAREVLRRASGPPGLASAYARAQSKIPWHPCLSVARGVAADIRFGTADADVPELLIALIGHPLEIVSLCALEQSLGLWATHPKVSKAALMLFLSLCRVPALPARAQRDRDEAIHCRALSFGAAERVHDYYHGDGDWPVLTQPPPAWEKVDLRAARASGQRQVRQDAESGDWWAEPSAFWYAQFAAKALPVLPHSVIFAEAGADVFVDFLENLLKWTIEKIDPPWQSKPGDRDRSSASLAEWTRALGRALGQVAGFLPEAEVQSRFLDRIIPLKDDLCCSLLGPFADAFICAHVFDAQDVPPGANSLLDACLTRLLSLEIFSPASYRRGAINGLDENRLSRALMFVGVEHASLAARFVNGDWREVGRILPLIDRFVRAVGWSAQVMRNFLTLCERAKAHYPAETFADQVLAVLARGDLRDWHNSVLPAKTAELIQYFADRDSPMPPDLAQKLLRILDQLIDMGDRRAASLQYSEAFREVHMR